MSHCHFCSAKTPKEARFCPACGTPLSGAPKSPDDANNTIQLPEIAKKSGWGAGKLLLAGAAVLLVAGAGLYLRSQWDRSQRNLATRELIAELERLGATSVGLTIDDRWVATLSGQITGSRRRDDALETLRRRPLVKAVLDRSTVRPDAAELQSQIESKLRSDGFAGYDVAVDEQLNVLISGQSDSPGQTSSMLATVKTIDFVKSVRGDIRLSRSGLQSQLQAYLNTKKWDFIRGFVTDDSSILLLGAVGNAAQKKYIEQEVRAQFPDATLQSELGIWRSMAVSRGTTRKRVSAQKSAKAN